MKKVPACLKCKKRPCADYGGFAGYSVWCAECNAKKRKRQTERRAERKAIAKATGKEVA